MEEKPYRISIGSAGNTQVPALLALRAKGYKLWLHYVKISKDNYDSNYQAERDGAYFSATTPVELLGLVAMWEVRGDDWRFNMGDEDDIDDELYKASRTFDCDGNEVFEDD